MITAEALLADHRRRAEERLAAVAGDVTLCVIGRSGESFPGVKFHEGAAAALMDVGRRTQQTPIEATLEDVIANWGAALTDAHDRLGADWIAYRQGGLDELEAFSRELAAARGSEEEGVTRRHSDGVIERRSEKKPAC